MITMEERVAGIVEHIDGKIVDEREIDFVSSSKCLNCDEAHDPALPVLVVRTAGGILWWHRYHCAAVPEKDI